MNRWLTVLLTAALLLGGRPGRADAPLVPPLPGQGQKRVLYYATEARLLTGNKPPRFWKDAGLGGLIVPLPLDFFSASLTEGEVLDHCRRVRQAMGNLELFLAFECTNYTAGRQDRLRSTLGGWDDDAGWGVFLRNLGYLSSAARAVKADGVLMDAEDYLSSSDMQGGKMLLEYGWTPSARAAERARQYVGALRSEAPSLILGNYVTYLDAIFHQGYQQFWSEAYAAAGGGVTLFEDGYTVNWTDFARMNQHEMVNLGGAAGTGLGLTPDTFPGFPVQTVSRLRDAWDAGSYLAWIYDGPNKLMRDPTVAPALRDTIQRAKSSAAP
jgi:hypothetical protein